MKYTIEQAEMQYGESIEDVIWEYVESCVGTGHYLNTEGEIDDAVRFFLDENDLLHSEYGRVRKLILDVWQSAYEN